jgi:hypothetical protein
LPHIWRRNYRASETPLSVGLKPPIQFNAALPALRAVVNCRFASAKGKGIYFILQTDIPARFTKPGDIAQKLLKAVI